MKKTILLTAITIISAMAINTSNAQYSKKGNEFKHPKIVALGDSHNDEFHGNIYAKDETKSMFINKFKGEEKEQLYGNKHYYEYQKLAHDKFTDHDGRDAHRINYNDRKERY